MTETLATALAAVEIFAARHPRHRHNSYSRMVPATGIELSMLARIVVKRVY